MSCYSYIANLDPNFLRALAERASDHEAEALRGITRKHLAFQSSIEVVSNVSHANQLLFVVQSYGILVELKANVLVSDKVLFHFPTELAYMLL
jgi:hypothetical protein